MGFCSFFNKLFKQLDNKNQIIANQLDGPRFRHKKLQTYAYIRNRSLNNPDLTEALLKKK